MRSNNIRKACTNNVLVVVVVVVVGTGVTITGTCSTVKDRLHKIGVGRIDERKEKYACI